jgi:AhpD family alkylhydroperoxidase
MARITKATSREAGLRTRLVYFFTRRSLTKLSGRAPEAMLEPLEVMAHAPGLLAAYGRLEQASAKLRRVDRRLGDLAELKAATLVGCAYCIDLGSQIARRRSAATDEQLLALPRYRESALFSDLEKLVLDYAAAISQTPVDVPDALFARLREHFDDAQLVELTFAIALENLRGRFNLALGIDAAGFSPGVCPPPAHVIASR